MGNLTYKKMQFDDDIDITYLVGIYKMPEIARYLSISDNYFHYVTNTENVYFFATCLLFLAYYSLFKISILLK